MGALLLAGPRQPLQSIFPDRFQHADARRVVRRLALPQQALVDERGEPLQRVAREFLTFDDAYCLDGLDRGAVREDGEAAKKRLFADVQQAVAPVDRRAHGLLSLGQVARPARQERQAALHAEEQSPR